MILVDTSAWIEWFVDSPLAIEIERRLPERSDWLVPTIVQFELAKWLTREIGPIAANDVGAFSQACIVIPLDTPFAFAASAIAARHRLATADAIIYATACAHEALLLTCDAHFETLLGVHFVPKS